MRDYQKIKVKMLVKELLDSDVEVTYAYAGMLGLTEIELNRILDSLIYENREEYEWIRITVKNGARRKEVSDITQ